MTKIETSIESVVEKNEGKVKQYHMGLKVIPHLVNLAMAHTGDRFSRKEVRQELVKQMEKQ